MRSSPASAVAAAVHAAVVIGVALVVLAVAGTGAAIAAGVLLFLVTQPARRSLAARLAGRVGPAAARRTALVRALQDDLAGRDAFAATGPGALLGALGAPYAALDVLTADGAVRLAEHGGLGTERTRTVPIVHDGDVVGLLEHAVDDDATVAAARATLAEQLAAVAAPSLSAMRLRGLAEQERRRAVGRRAEQRLRLSHELHDRVGPSLAALKMMLAARGDREDPELDRALAAQARELAREARDVAGELGPARIDEAGLVAAVETAAARMAVGSGLRIAVESSLEAEPASRQARAAAYAIVLEALNNVVRHANATACTVRLAASGALEVVVEDDGVGIGDADGGGLGLASMRRRAAELGGTVDVARRPEGGTRLSAVLPLSAGARAGDGV